VTATAAAEQALAKQRAPQYGASYASSAAANSHKARSSTLWFQQVRKRPVYNQEVQLSLGWADCTVYIRKSASDFRSRKESDFPVTTDSYTGYGDAAISNATINAMITIR